MLSPAFQSRLAVALLLLSASATADVRIECIHDHLTALQLRAPVEGNTFITQRGLWTYIARFGRNFAGDLARLTNRSHWVDSGAGIVQAARDYYVFRPDMTDPEGISPSSDLSIPFIRQVRRMFAGVSNRSKARVTAITYTADDSFFGRPDFSIYGNRIRVLEGRFFEEIPDSEIGRADIITDLFGVIHYTQRIDLVLKRYLGLLKRRGVIYTNVGNLGRDIIHTPQGDMSAADWIATIPGIGIERIKGLGQEGHLECLRIKRAKGVRIKIPALELVSYSTNQVGKNPVRKYRIHLTAP